MADSGIFMSRSVPSVSCKLAQNSGNIDGFAVDPSAIGRTRRASAKIAVARAVEMRPEPFSPTPIGAGMNRTFSDGGFHQFLGRVSVYRSSLLTIAQR